MSTISHLVCGYKLNCQQIANKLIVAQMLCSTSTEGEWCICHLDRSAWLLQSWKKNKRYTGRGYSPAKGVFLMLASRPMLISIQTQNLSVTLYNIMNQQSIELRFKPYKLNASMHSEYMYSEVIIMILAV